MGGQGALQLGYRYARQFPIVVAISPKVDFETWWGHDTSLDTLFSDREAARQRTAILQLHPLNYPKHQLLLCDPHGSLLLRRSADARQQVVVDGHSGSNMTSKLKPRRLRMGLCKRDSRTCDRLYRRQAGDFLDQNGGRAFRIQNSPTSSLQVRQCGLSANF